MYLWNKQHTELAELNASFGFVIKLYVLGKHHFSGLERVPDHVFHFQYSMSLPKNNDLQYCFHFVKKFKKILHNINEDLLHSKK